MRDGGSGADEPTAAAVAKVAPAGSGRAPRREEAAIQAAPAARSGRRLSAAWQRLERRLAGGLPATLDPFVQAGAIANTCLAIACVTGVALLPWYVPSVHEAHASVAALADSRSPGGLLRSLHRYSSDACLAFVLVHALRLALAGRFTGGRWLSWLTGVGLLATLWFIGWTGYWLVWDQPAREVALATARLLDALPILSDPLGRSFLVDEQVNSLLFFLVFFAHVLLPMALAVGLWLHVARLSRPRLFTCRPLTVAVLISLTGLALVLPAGIGPPARLAEAPGRMTMDAWYLLPLLLTDRVSAGAAWGLVLALLVGLVALPWLPRRRSAAPAVVDVARCNACGRCVQDCPHEAISMAPRSDGRRWPAEARVLADRCVACGVCAGACDSAGIDLPHFATRRQRERLDAWIDDAGRRHRRPRLVLGCAHSAASDLAPDAATGAAAGAPGWQVLEVPCAGWIHPLTVERALRRGAEVVVVACAPGRCAFREGGQVIRQRLAGEREPALRREKVEVARLRLLEMGPGEVGALARALAGAPPAKNASSSRWRRRFAAAGLLVGATALVGAGSRVPHEPPRPPGPEIVLSFRHAGQAGERCRDLTPAEIEALPFHLRRTQECERARAPVRVRLRIDGEVVLKRAYQPTGLWKDGPSIALETLVVAPGWRRLSVELGDGHDPEEWGHRAEHVAGLESGRRLVILFEREAGFTFH